MANHLKEGDILHVSGPKGKFSLVPDQLPPKLLFLGAGSGVTPLMSMARWLCDLGAGVDVRFFNSVRSPSDIIFRKELELLTQRHKIFSPVIVTSTRTAGQDWMGPTGRINRHILESAAPDLHERHVYMCGPAGFMESAKSVLYEMGFDPTKLHLESFDGARAPSWRERDADETAKFKVEFARSGKVAFARASANLLELIEAQDIEVNYGCRSGSCGDCKVKVLKGDVGMSCEDGLEAGDKASGYVLSCVATVKSDCVLDL
jgi:ferredoxin-NADP reductase